MSSSSWLQKQRKADLQELADGFGIKDTDGMKKSDLELKIDDYLTANTQLSNDSRVAPFYNRRAVSVGSPIKKEITKEASILASETEKVAKAVKRKVTKATEDLSNAVSSALTEDSDEPVTTRARNAVVARTPRVSSLSFPSNVPLPPSPSVVADAIDRRTAVIRSKINDVYEQSGAMEYAQATRESLSTVVSVEVLIILFEIYCLRQEVLADRYAFTIPAIKLFGTRALAVKIPDMFLVLTSSFWGPTMLWTITSLFVPLMTAYFFNLTSKPKTGRSHVKHFTYDFDPLTFNIVKALLTYVVYGQDYTFGGLVDLEYVARINSAFYGGWPSVLVGCGIGILVTFYEAIIQK